jgi:nucleoside-diphosphate-sugar epimerase
MMKEKVTIIGGSGFIGTSLAKKLEKEQLDFEIMDLNISARFPEVSTIADIRNKSVLLEALKKHTVINLAAVHRDDIQDPLEYYSTNVDGARNLCSACEEKGINKIIFASSVAVYGNALAETSENGKLGLYNDYGKSKILAEDVYRDWQKRDPKRRSLIIIRPTVVFGEGNRGNLYNLFKQINSGWFAMIGNGKNRKSIAYVENLAEFLLKCIDLEEKYVVYNYVDTPDFSMNELVSLVHGKLRGRPSVTIRVPKFIGLMAGYIADFLSKFGVKLPISSIRIKKFCTSSEFASTQGELNGFVAPYTLQEGLDRTLEAEFINSDPDRQLFYTE